MSTGLDAMRREQERAPNCGGTAEDGVQVAIVRRPIILIPRNPGRKEGPGSSRAFPKQVT